MPQSKVLVQWFSNLAVPYCYLENKKSWALSPAPTHPAPKLCLGWGPSISFKCSPSLNVILWTARVENSWSKENNPSKQEWFVEFQPCPEWHAAKVFNCLQGNESLNFKESNSKTDSHFTKNFFIVNITVKLSHVKLLIFDCFWAINENFVSFNLYECIYFLKQKMHHIQFEPPFF